MGLRNEREAYGNELGVRRAEQFPTLEIIL